MRLLAGDLRTGLIRVRNIPASTGTVVTNLNGAGTITATIQLPLIDPQTNVAIPLTNIIVPGKSFLALEHNGKIINAGPIWNDKYDFDTQKLTMNAAGLLSYFDHRYVIPLLQDGVSTDLPVGKVTAYTTARGTATSLRTIAKRLVQQTRTWTGGDLPITFESDFAGSNERTYNGADLIPVSEAIRNITNVESGVDTAFRPQFKAADPNYIEWAMVTGNTELKQSGPDHVWDTTVPVPAIKGASFIRDGSLLATDSYQLGESSQATTSRTNVIGNALLIPGLGTNWTAIGTGGSLSTADLATVGLYNTTTTSGLAAGTFGLTTTLNVGVGVGDLAASTSYTVSVEIAAYVTTPVDKNVTLSASGAGVASTVSTTFATVSQQPTRRQITFTTAASGTVTLSIVNGAVTVVGTNVVWGRRMQVEKTSTFNPDTPFFVGSTPTVGVTEYAWTGDANASPSIEITTLPYSAKSYDATLVTAGWPRLESSGNRPTNSNVPLLQQYANDATLQGRYQEETWTFQANRETAPTFGSYESGDYAVIVIKNNPRLADGRYRVRILSITAYLEDQFVSIECAPERA